MITVEATLAYWTPSGMRSSPPTTTAVPFISAQEAEQLLAEAHERGRQAGITQAREILTTTRTAEGAREQFDIARRF